MESLTKTPIFRSKSKQPAMWTLLLVVLFSSQFSQAEWFHKTWPIMGTKTGARFWLDAPNFSDPAQQSEALKAQQQKAQKLLELVRQEMHRIDVIYSPYIDTSALSKINAAAASTPQLLSQEFAALVDKALWVSQASDGAFDITYASVGHLYDYRNKIAPGDEDISKTLPAIGSDRLMWDRKNRTLAFTHPLVKIDLGGLAKGYAVDRGADILRNHGIKHGSVNAGGDTALIGDNRGRPWFVGIKNPRLTGEEKNWQEQQVLKLPLINEAISTSGDYERFFIDEQNGNRVHHIINPKTGKSSNGLISVSVFGPQGINTDPLSTAIFVMGVEKGLNLINSIQSYEAVLITDTGKVLYSDGLVDPNAN